jgi:hypothetical protein
VLLWDPATGQQLRAPLMGHDDAIRCLRVLGEGELLLSGSYDGKIRLWSSSTGDCLRVFDHGSQVEALDTFPNGQMFLSAGGDGGVKIWTLAGSLAEQGPSCHSRAITDVMVLKSGDAFVTCSNDGTAKVRSTRDLSVLFTWDVANQSVVGVAGGHGEDLVFADEDGKVTWRGRLAKEEPSGIQKTEQVIVMVGNPSNNKESHIDFLLRKFEYAKIGNMLIQENSSVTILQSLAAIDELAQRNALQAALQKLDNNQMIKVCEFVARSLTAHPEHTGLLIQFAEAALAANPQIDAALVPALTRLQKRTEQEIGVINKMSPLLGTLQTLMLV